MLLSQNNRAGLDVAMDLKMSSQAPSVSGTLSWNSGGMGSSQEPFHICVLVDCRARLTDLLAPVMTEIVSR